MDIVSCGGRYLCYHFCHDIWNGNSGVFIQYFGIRSVGNSSAHALSPPLMSLTSWKLSSSFFIISTASCESFPNLQTTKTRLSREICARLVLGSLMRSVKGMSDRLVKRCEALMDTFRIWKAADSELRLIANINEDMILLSQIRVFLEFIN
jgi:hypothetical protein